MPTSWAVIVRTHKHRIHVDCYCFSAWLIFQNYAYKKQWHNFYCVPGAPRISVYLFDCSLRMCSNNSNFSTSYTKNCPRLILSNSFKKIGYQLKPKNNIWTTIICPKLRGIYFIFTNVQDFFQTPGMSLLGIRNLLFLRLYIGYIPIYLRGQYFGKELGKIIQRL